jgi:outer membrane protein assembly factor BamB
LNLLDGSKAWTNQLATMTASGQIMAAHGNVYFNMEGIYIFGQGAPRGQFIGEIVQNQGGTDYPRRVGTYSEYRRLKAVTDTYVIGEHGNSTNTAIDATGKVLGAGNWSRQVPSRSAIATQGDRVFSSSGNINLAFSATNQVVYWSNTISHAVSHLVPGQQLFAAGSNVISALDLGTGTLTATHQSENSDLILARPDGMLYVGRRTNHLDHLDLFTPQTGERRQVIPDAVSDAVILHDGLLLVAVGNRLLAYTADGSQVRWSYEADQTISAPLLVSRFGLIVFAAGTNLHGVQGPAGVADVGWPMRHGSSQKRNWVPHDASRLVQGLPLQISLTIEKRGAELLLTVPTLLGTTLWLERATTLNSSWTTDRAITGTGQVERVTIPATNASGFYRLRLDRQ